MMPCDLFCLLLLFIGGRAWRARIVVQVYLPACPRCAVGEETSLGGCCDTVRFSTSPPAVRMPPLQVWFPIPPYIFLSFFSSAHSTLGAISGSVE
ncbi:hypothetical protein, unlikely [Trypanosoma brucei brucei TREU927]|uniref:Secreted protein n=2 Tax=Trypanosoma brucei brucei (strain 927/4 GUTat10.1) TaxID=185431 RepID=Q4GYX6_TRYB2|nr:hypothetical protein, unlikely [Trypanosoma brucei brucei TREU927]XP_001218945.1 hypothetical protein, unlikely [Trypanosoma brucei brucei TREU927]XP_001218947.1 hypothetical protein, unlikely [Trypanosoma brucei brucei TREU927]XP_001218953.1 hypothetical protein TB927.1.2540 [Trypanosoma brucei brucei TREU927]XP_001218955.1 hypothetical protein, unlikely [Trypanosoma brucei brucei TREU927]CAJ16382.1 hypothetical protein, unlikely [Trypanosoma brucei brucei TREU927]CAJ16384.1 hypothetical 